MRNGYPTIENTESENQNLSFEKLFIYYGAKGLKLNPETFEKNLSFVMENGKYNMLAQLLSDDSGTPVRVAIFSGKEKSDELFSVREFGHQCLLYTLEDVLRYGDILNILQADERGRVVERKEVPLFDNSAFREAVINAFVHNKWVSGNEPMISVFSDRIEILSRGALDREQTMEGFFAGESIPVNKKLSEIFLQLHISEKTGRGVPKIVSKYGRSAFTFRENSIVVTIPFNWIKEMRTEVKPGDKLGDKPGDKLGDKLGDKNRKEVLPKVITTKEKVYVAILNNPNITKPEIAALLRIGKTTVDNYITELKKDGKIRRVGSNKTGYWEVL